MPDALDELDNIVKPQRWLTSKYDLCAFIARRIDENSKPLKDIHVSDKAGHLGLWLDRATIQNPEASIPKLVLRNAYFEACSTEGWEPPGERMFTVYLRRVRPSIRIATANDKHPQLFCGLELKSTSILNL